MARLLKRGDRVRYGPRRRQNKTAAVALVLAGLWAGLGAGMAAADPLRLLALGDSLTQGYGLPAGEGLVPQLQAWLRGQGLDVHVINAGVSGDTTAGGRARIDWALAEDPDAVMVALGGNDLLRGLPPAEARANLEAILATIDARGLPALIAGLPAPPNYGAGYKADFDAIWPELAAAHDAVLVENLLGPIAALPPETRAERGLMQADGIHPSARGVEKVVEALGPRVAELLARVPQRP
ncbi:arylesterase [Phaeovulum vinaykumarii]|uniref:arylesterase n=1 Tax=Phaeovulum vinaykumarii TaxID=407234 RepID=UPI000A07A2CE